MKRRIIEKNLDTKSDTIASNFITMIINRKHKHTSNSCYPRNINYQAAAFKMRNKFSVYYSDCVFVETAAKEDYIGRPGISF